MGSKHSRNDILQAAVAVLAERGVGGLSFRTVGDRLGIADRTVVYYFPTKTALLQEAVRAGSEELRTLLTLAFGEAPLTPDRLIARGWPVMSHPDALPWVRVYVELVSAGSRGGEPHRSLAREITETWIAWLTERVVADTPEERRAGAIRVVAEIDGRLLLALVDVGTDDLDGARNRAGGTSANTSD